MNFDLTLDNVSIGDVNLGHINVCLTYTPEEMMALVTLYKDVLPQLLATLAGNTSTIDTDFDVDAFVRNVKAGRND